MWPGWKLLYATFRPGHRLHAWPLSSVSWCETDSRVVSKPGIEKGKNARWKEARYLHQCSKTTHSSIMNISFGLYTREKEISSVLSPQKFIAASTAGIAFYQDTIEALHFQEEVQPLEYPITRRKKHPFFDQKYWRLYTIVRFLPLSTLLSLRFSFSFMASSFPQLYIPI